MFSSLRFLLYSVLLHIAIAGILFVSIDTEPTKIIPPKPTGNIIKATAIDSKQVEKELSRLKDIEKQKQDKEKKKLQDLERKLKELNKKAALSEKKRKKEEKQLADLKKKKTQEEKQRKEEQKKLAEIKKQKEEMEQQRKLEEEKKKKAEEERKRLEEEKRKADEERKRKQAEEALKKQLAAEQKAQEEAQAAAQAKQDLSVIQQYGARIQNAIAQQFNTAGLPPGLSCVFKMRMIPGGEVVEARIVKSSGNAVFDRRAEVAVSKASPLPVPDNPRIFEKMREIRLTFTPN